MASLPRLSARLEAVALALILLAALAVRLAAAQVMPMNLADADQASYYQMAQAALGPAPMRDIWGNVAFYSPGYPFVLAPFFAVFGATPIVVLSVNLLLGAVAILLLHALARRLAGGGVALLAALFFALLAQMVVACVGVTRENLSVPLLLCFALAVVALPDTRRPGVVGGLAGLAYGAGVLAGGSVLLTALAVPVALWRRHNRASAAGALAAFMLGAALVIGPWLWHTADLLGRPVLTTNAPFNLYVGNNPKATGHFVSMRDSPLGGQWRVMHRAMGELAATDMLGSMARDHIAANPGQTALLSAKKLALFWLPNTPEPGDGHGAAMTLLRWGAAAQQMLLLLLAGLGCAGWRRFGHGMQLVLAIAMLFWAVHAAAYVMPRYCLPAMPFVCLLAAGAALPLARRVAPFPAKMVPA